MSLSPPHIDPECPDCHGQGAVPFDERRPMDRVPCSRCHARSCFACDALLPRHESWCRASPDAVVARLEDEVDHQRGRAEAFWMSLCGRGEENERLRETIDRLKAERSAQPLFQLAVKLRDAYWNYHGALGNFVNSGGARGKEYTDLKEALERALVDLVDHIDDETG